MDTSHHQTTCWSPFSNALKTFFQSWFIRRCLVAVILNLSVMVMLVVMVFQKDWFYLENSPCGMTRLGVQDMLYYTDDRQVYHNNSSIYDFSKCFTDMSILVMCATLALIAVAEFCLLLQIALEVSRLKNHFLRRMRTNTFFGVAAVLICSIILGLLYWTATLISYHQFELLNADVTFVIPVNVNVTMQQIFHQQRRLQQFSLSLSEGFYLVLGSGILATLAIAVRCLQTPLLTFHVAYLRHREPWLWNDR